MKLPFTRLAPVTAFVLTSAIAASAHAAFVGYTVVSTNVTNSGQQLVRYEIYATFDGLTDTVLNVFNLSLLSTTEADGYGAFWHKDNNDTSAGVLSQAMGVWLPQLTGSASNNRPYDSYLSIGATAGPSSTTAADPSWNSGGSGTHAGDARGWARTDLVDNNTLGWFNSSPPNLQGRVNTDGNPSTTVKVAQMVLSLGHGTRVFSLRTAWNNGAGSGVSFSDASFTLTSCMPSVWYRDIDGDGLGSEADGTQSACTQPTGYVADNTDNCPAIANAAQEDCDADGIGDVCAIAAGASDFNDNDIPDNCAGEFVVGGSGYASIQAAIDAAPDGTTILVTAGTWAPIDLSDRALTLLAHGAAGTVIIDGAGTSRCVTIHSSTPTVVVLDGLVIRNGSAIDGGGVSALTCEAQFIDCIFESNTATNRGGALFCSGEITLVNTVVEGNSAALGGGVFIDGGALSAETSWFCLNTPDNIAGTYSDAGGNTLSSDCNSNGLCDIDELDDAGADSDADDRLDECERAWGDFNLDNVVNPYDLAVILFYWGAVSPPSGDCNSDGTVDSTDLSILLAHWGSTL